jgi:NDP-sugar pyrophosphorylase family protein
VDTVYLHGSAGLCDGFVAPEHLPEGEDAYYLRRRQNPGREAGSRRLTSEEREALVRNGNNAENWDSVLVSADFDPDRIRQCSFYGEVRLGRVQDAILEHHDLRVPVGLYSSVIADCDIGDDCALHHVHYLAHYILGERCIIANVDEMHTTNHAKFGNGIVKDGEPEEVRVWLDIMNETGSRGVMPFDGMITADAYLWARYRDDKQLQKRLGEITQSDFDSARGYYGEIGDQTVIKTTRILKDVKVGEHCYIKGANKLKNLTINSSVEEPTQIGEGVELVNGIIGYGCHIFYGCKAVRFILGNNSNLKYGARLINSFLGDNSTISCCEVLNNLIFPAHEQHHNNSFLIAAVVKGQSNLAAGVTAGSNHNSRANDNELEAGRGFWPGLCTSIKHSSRFASFTLIAKGAYPAELDIRLPFSLLNNNEKDGVLEVMPAFWWLHNMYALARNSWKFRNRDKRKSKVQHIEFDYLAPDTVEEILEARDLLALWTAQAAREVQNTDRAQSNSVDGKARDAIIRRGHVMLTTPGALPDDLEIYGEGMEKSRRQVRIVKAPAAYEAYGHMLVCYGVKNAMAYLQANGQPGLESMNQELCAPRIREWVNMGGQLMTGDDVDALRAAIDDGRLSSWREIHNRYDELWEHYDHQKQRHAYAVLCGLLGVDRLSHDQWVESLRQAGAIQIFIRDQVFATRQKDFGNPFRRATYRSPEEMSAAIGTIEDNSFVHQVREETTEFLQAIEEAISAAG